MQQVWGEGEEFGSNKIPGDIDVDAAGPGTTALKGNISVKYTTQSSPKWKA